MKYINKKLTIEKLSVETIAKKYGTPAYCYSFKQFKKNILNFKENFKSFSPLICFAIKSNANLNLIKEIKQFGLGADVVSMGELMMALKAGINPKKIVFSGVGAEERGQAEAIAKSIECSMKLTVPTIAIIIGEGGSGGAIALASSNKVIMLQNAIYSVISPEGCATILWRDPKKTLEAATAMKMSSSDLLKLNIIDEIIPEPVGGAHRDKDLILDNVRDSLKKNLDFFETMDKDEILTHRKNKFLSIGRNKGFTTQSDDGNDLSMKASVLENINQNFKKNSKIYYGVSAVALLILLLSIVL